MKTFIMFFLTGLMSVSCNTLSLPDDYAEQNSNNNNNNNNNNSSQKSDAASLTYFAFLQEDNPSLEADIVCTNLKPTDLILIPQSELTLPQMLKPRFNVDGGTLYYNGDEMISGESEMYCSDRQKAFIRIEGDDGKNLYHYISFIPYTGLPVIEVTTDDGKAIGSKTVWQKGQLAIHGMGMFMDHSDSVYVRKRGNGTAAFPKTAFNVKYSKKRSVLGMPKRKHWVFLANFRDRTEIRNAVALELGRMADKLEWTPRWQYANIIVNGKLEGLYQITEKVEIGSDRVDIDELESDAYDLSGGYLLELDRYYDRTWKFKSAINGWPVNIKEPEDDVCNDTMFAYIQQYYNDFEKALVDGDYATVYDKYIDLESFIDYGIVQSLTNNGEFFNTYSVFNYKKKGGKIYAGPLWDFDYSTFNTPTKQLFTSGIWYKYLKNDTLFTNKVKARWSEYISTAEPRIYTFIDSLESVLSRSAHIDETIYPFSQYMPAMLNGDETMTFEESIELMKTVISERIRWMDEKIKGL